MPLVRLQAPFALEPAKLAGLMKELSSTTASVLSKPEQYVMVVVEQEIPILFAGTPEPAAFLEVASAGEVSPEVAKNLSYELSIVVGRAAAITPERIFLKVEGIAPTHWGFCGTTLAG